MSNEQITENNTPPVETTTETPAPTETKTEAPVSSTTQETQQTTQSWKDVISEEYRNDPNISKFTEIDALAKSYINATKMIGQDKMIVPNKNFTDDQWQEAYAKMGRPESADKYNLKIDSQAIQVDESDIKQFAENAHKLGLNNQQAQGILEFYKSNLETDAQQARVDTETAQAQSEQELRKEWGRDFESKVQAAGAVANANIGEEILDLELKDGTRIGDHPAIIKGFSKIAGMISEDTMVQPDTDVQDTAFDLEEEISTIINNTDGPYWNKQHPEHDKIVQRVYTLREMLNNAKPE